MKLRSTLIAAFSAAAMATSQAFTIDFNAISYTSDDGDSWSYGESFDVIVDGYGTVTFTNVSAGSNGDDTVEIGDNFKDNDGTSVESLQLESGEKVMVTFHGDAEVINVEAVFTGISPDPFDTGVLRGSEVEYYASTIDITNLGGEYTTEDGVGLQSITWDVVPEPSSAALGAIGMSMILLRRRKV